MVKCRVPGPSPSESAFEQNHQGIPVHTEVGEAVLYPHVPFLPVTLTGSHVTPTDVLEM